MRILLSLLFVVGFATSAYAGTVESAVKTLKVDHGISPAGQKCVQCHQEKTPGIIADWKMSRHAHAGVSCIDCHTLDKGNPMAAQNCPGVKGTDMYVSILVSPKTCARCHAKQVEQAGKGGHARGALQYQDPKNPGYKTFFEGLVRTHEGQNHPECVESSNITGCMQCHGSIIKLDENKRPTFQTWPTYGVGTVYPDGGIGNCVTCHTRHTFKISEARKPAACASCHLGPDHPDIEIYNNSKHGHIFNAEGTTWNYDSAPGAWQPGDYRAPTCATCHMSGIGDLSTTHNISERLYWNLWAGRSEVRNGTDPMDPLVGNGPEGRQKMKQVCSNCHTALHTESFFKQADPQVKLYNEAYYDEALKMKKDLAERGLLKKNPWADTFQNTFYHLWHHEGRRMRQGALMGGPDYAHWHGVFETMQDLYEMQDIYNKRMETGKIED